MTTETTLSSTFAGKKVLITGGAGFIGSNLAIRLVELGAQVTVVDAMLPDYGGNLFNLRSIRDQIRLNFSDVRDPNIMRYLVRGQDYLFHLAGQMDHVLSLTDPFPDIDINIKGTAVVMEACRYENPQIRMIYTGTRGQYGHAVSLPVSEEAPTRPTGIHEVSRLAAESIVKIYHDIHQVRSVMLRLTNIYGPRAQMRHSRYGVANWFIRLAVDDDTIKVFGQGNIQRDFLYVEDAVQALLMSAACDDAYGQVFNVGVDHPTTFQELAEVIVEVAQTGHWEYAPFSAERKAQEPGHYYSDISKIRRVVGWEPETPIHDGVRTTVEYYRAHRDHYWIG
jgi:UDP-glucose 4-epimerase